MLWPPHLLDFEPRALRENLSCRRDFMLEMVAGTRIKVRAETVLTRTRWTLAPARKALIELAAKPVMVIADPCRQAQANARLRHDPIRTGRRQRRSVVPDAHHSQRGLGRKSGQAHSGSPFSHPEMSSTYPYPFSPCMPELTAILTKLRDEPAREPLPPPKVYAPPRATSVLSPSMMS